MMGSNVIDQRHVNLVGMRSLVGCGLMCSHRMFAFIGGCAFSRLCSLGLGYLA